ncbi:ATP-binding protein [Actinoplanes sp. NPDC049802]|uniref:ATP-binding protein n=1 Tax=Actinoplanes sp. NPDC049802 TaxID=3154742 RepID=UPI0033D16322
MSVQRRLNLGFSVLLGLFVALLLVQFGAAPRTSAAHERRLDRITRAEIANDRVLQRMTDAETGVRGYQLTGDTTFLEPYEKGWTAALAALDTVAAGTDRAGVRRLLDRQRAAVGAWLDGYARPIVAAGPADTAPARAVAGKRMFDELRLINAAVREAVGDEHDDIVAAGHTTRRTLGLVAAALVAAILAAGHAVARTGRRQLLVPLEQLGRTIRRLAAGDRSARAEPVGATELRTVVEALNDLAAQTERLLAEEHARTARAGLRQAVAAEMQDMTDPAVTTRRIAELVGAAVGAGSVHSEIILPGPGPVRAVWPTGAPEPAESDGPITVGYGGDAECAPGHLRVSRPGDPAWTDAEQRLLAGVAREIERAVRQHTMHHHQSRLITELRMLDQRKDVFVQTVTHELRTPLTSILGYAEIIDDVDGERLTGVQHRALKAILRNAHRLHETIGDLILLDRPENGAAVDAENLDLAAVAAAVHHELRNAARAKELAVTFDTGEAWVRGDRAQLQRALRKLVENAIKFTPVGGSVTCRLTTDDHTVAMTVTDTGIGIPAEDVSGLFTPFHRAGNAMAQAVQGPGLGLAIVRDIVRDHGGTITVQSVVGRGSTFTLTLPAIPAPVPTPV